MTDKEVKRYNDNMITKLLDICKYIEWKNVENFEDFNKLSKEHA